MDLFQVLGQDQDVACVRLIQVFVNRIAYKTRDFIQQMKKKINGMKNYPNNTLNTKSSALLSMMIALNTCIDELLTVKYEFFRKIDVLIDNERFDIDTVIILYNKYVTGANTIMKSCNDQILQCIIDIDLALID